jgi:hypothetical protein
MLFGAFTAAIFDLSAKPEVDYFFRLLLMVQSHVQNLVKIGHAVTVIFLFSLSWTFFAGGHLGFSTKLELH